MPYPEILIKPMREDLTRFGVEETRTPEDLDEVIRNTKGTVMIVVNSVCGCAAGLARPAIGMALAHPVKPDRVVTVFAAAILPQPNARVAISRDTFRRRHRWEFFKTARLPTCWNAIRSKAGTLK